MLENIFASTTCWLCVWQGPKNEILVESSKLLPTNWIYQTHFLSPSLIVGSNDIFTFCKPWRYVITELRFPWLLVQLSLFAMIIGHLLFYTTAVRASQSWLRDAPSWDPSWTTPRAVFQLQTMRHRNVRMTGTASVWNENSERSSFRLCLASPCSQPRLPFTLVLGSQDNFQTIHIEHLLRGQEKAFEWFFFFFLLLMLCPLRCSHLCFVPVWLSLFRVRWCLAL